MVTIDFITKLPRTTKQHDSIMVVVDKLNKDAHFIPLKLTHKASNIADIYMKKVVKIRELPKEIVLDRDTEFTSKFWKGLLRIWDKFKSQYNISPRVRWENKED